MQINVTFSLDNSILSFLKVQFAHIEQKLDALKTQGEITMSQLDDLNTAIQAEDVQIQALAPVVTKVDTDLAALAAAIKANVPPQDLLNQIQAIQSHTAALKTGIQQLSDADTAATTPGTPA